MRLLIQTLIFTLLLTSITTAALAAELSIVPSIRVAGRYDSNLRFLPDGSNVNGSQGIIFDIRLPMLYRSPSSSVSLSTRIVRSFYREEKNADLEDRNAYLTGGASRSFRRSSIGAGYGYTNLSLRTSELENPGGTPGDPSGGGTLFINDDTQKSWYFQPNWQYQFSAANLVSLNGGYREVRYDEERVSRRFDYDFSNATAAFQHAFNERHLLALQANFTKFDSENESIRITNDSTTNGLSLVYTYTWSNKASIATNLGWARTKGSVTRPNNFNPVTQEPFCDPNLIIVLPCETKSDVTNFVGNMTLTQNTETNQYRISFGQSITPNSNGAEVLRLNFNATAGKKFSERLSGRLGILTFTQSDLGNSQFDFSRDYIRGTLGFNYKLTRKWSLFSLYHYTFIQQNSILIDRNRTRNHFVSIGISFQGDGWRW